MHPCTRINWMPGGVIVGDPGLFVSGFVGLLCVSVTSIVRALLTPLSFVDGTCELKTEHSLPFSSTVTDILVHNYVPSYTLPPIIKTKTNQCKKEERKNHHKN